MFYICNYENNYKLILQEHKESYWYISIFKFDLCNNKYNERKQLKEHNFFHKRLPVYKCYKCKNPKWHQNAYETQK